MLSRHELLVDSDSVLLWDADGNLFPSEGPAFEASTAVTNRLLESLGSSQRWTPPALRKRSVGRNFRALAVELAEIAGAPLDETALEMWVEEENRAVMEHLGRTLCPDVAVLTVIRRLAGTYRMAVVSSSKLERLAMCFDATGLASYLPAEVHFSAQDSLPQPTSKPDPAVYDHAVRETGAVRELAIAIEDAPSGVASAVGAGLQTIGNLVFVPQAERRAQGEALLAAGACVIIEDWSELEGLLPIYAPLPVTMSR